ncbi:MAG: PIN domain nuclease [Blastocatellia bacterium]|nr:PIN domain nuclease [Blastocatellia bacterium]
MIFVDSSVWIDYINRNNTPHTEKLDSILGVQGIVIGDLVLAEVLQGCSDPRIFKETVRLFGLAEFVVIGGYRVSLAAARNYITLRSKGITVRKTIDTLIATRCIINDYELLHSDRDFLPFEEHLGLKCVL